MYRVVCLILLSFFLDTAVPSYAQERSAERARVLEDIRRTDRESAETAREWSMRNRVPRRIVQSNGTVVELVRVADGHPFYVAPANRTAASVTRTRYLHPGERLGLGLTGAGLEIGIWDGGHVLSDHLELSQRVRFGDTSEVSDHATHVAGTLAAAGLDPRARGMAFESDLKSYSWTNDATEMTNEASAGLLLSNHSYSIISGWHYGDLENDGNRWYWLGDPAISTQEDYTFGWYDAPAVQFDRVTYANPYYLPVVAAGNDRLDVGPTSGQYRALDERGDYQTYYAEERPISRDGGVNGFDTISGAGVAKNVLTVGAVARPTTSGYVETSIFSSFGPSDDGRIKPDLMGLGEGVFSLSSEDRNTYGRGSGTSMAAPNVTGSLLLLQQYYNGVYGKFMRAATLKGLVLHTAADLGAPGPDYRSGWGLLNAEAAAAHITASVEQPNGLIEASLYDGEPFALDVTAVEGDTLRVTLSWTDHPSSRLPRLGASTVDDRTSHLRNDLDLRLVHMETGRIVEPYVLNPSDPGAPAAGGDNVVDPVEQVFIESAEAGRYAISVSHKGALYREIPQDFSLVISGAEGDNAPVAVARMSADADLDGVTLRWSTLFERRTGAFVVERGPLNSSGESEENAYVVAGEIVADGMTADDYEFHDDWSLAGRYSYRVVFVDGPERFPAGETKVNLAAPESYELISSYPNPFQDRVVLVLDLPRTQDAMVEVYDALGRRLLIAHDGELAAGRHRITIDGESWAAGVYFVRVSTPNGVTVRQLVRR